MRIVSLLPSATEIVCALGLGDQLAGITHECDYAPEAVGKPALTRSVLGDASMSSAEIDAAISGLLREGHSSGTIYHIDAATLHAVQPDLVLTQQLCDVCAVSFSQVQRAVGALAGDCALVSLEPTGIDEILASIAQVGALAGVDDRAEAVVAGLRRRIAAVVEAIGPIGERAHVWCAEWLDPPFGAGHWVPEQVALAGGEEIFGRAGKPSERMRWEAVLDLRPEVVVLLPCGYNLEQTVQEAASTGPPAGWDDLPAVRQGQVYAVDGSAYFSRPGPRVVDGLEIMAHILHPDRIPAPPPGRMAHLAPGSHPWAGPVH